MNTLAYLVLGNDLAGNLLEVVLVLVLIVVAVKLIQKL